MCSNATIPERLHTEEKPIVSLFNENELIYRRFPTEPIIAPDGNQISASTFPLNEDSCNRDKFCENYLDTLYSEGQVNDPYYYGSYGVLQFMHSELCKTYRLADTKDMREFEVRIDHVPTCCMYPHCQIAFILDGKETSPPKSIRIKVREKLLSICEIVKHVDK